MSEATQTTFEDGYRRMQDIAERLNSDEVPVHEMCDLFAEGEGLKAALGDYLEQQRQRVESIKAGEGVQAFEIVAPSADDGARTAGNGSTTVPTDTSDFAGNGGGASDDDIPF